VKPFWVYILKCSDDALYVGQTDDLEKRIAQHASGELRGYTCGRLPVLLVYAEEHGSRDDALVRERQIKGWSRLKKQALIQSNWGRLTLLARGRNRDDIDQRLEVPTT